MNTTDNKNSIHYEPLDEVCFICFREMSPYDSYGNYGTHRHLECMYMPRTPRNCRCCGNLITPYSESPNRAYCSGSCKES